MAKANTARLFGYVEKVKVWKSPDTGELLSGRVVMGAVSRARMTSNYVKTGPKITSHLIVVSYDPVVIKYMKNAREGDVVSIKGTLVSQDISRRYTCENCGSEFRLDRCTTEYVDPIYFGLRARKKSAEFESASTKETVLGFILGKAKNGIVPIFESAESLAKFIMSFLNSRGKESEGLAILDETQMESYVRKQGEIGNEFSCFGTLTRDPSPEDFFPGDERHPPSFKFQMAINRLRHIYTDNPDKKTDFIYFIAFGKYAEFYYNSLKKGSTVYVEGPIMTRKFNRKVTCPICGHVMLEPALSLYVKVQNLVFVKNCDYTTSDVGELDYDDISDMNEEKERALAKAVAGGQKDGNE